jgi:hypothetical protein
MAKCEVSQAVDFIFVEHFFTPSTLTSNKQPQPVGEGVRLFASGN